jgi:predicted acetyltransferase
MIEAEEARSLLPALHDRWRRATPGAIGRDDGWWDFLLLDREHRRDGLSPLFHTVHPDGFVTYRVRPQSNEGFPAHEVEVIDLFPVTAGAHADLWRFLLSIDLVGVIRTWDAPPGDPLPFLLDQPRQARTTNIGDDVWVRLLDVPAALGARTYQVDGALVLEVHDGFLDRGGRFLLDGGPSGATCVPTDREPDLELGIAALGSLYLGGHNARTLAEAGLVGQRTAGAVHRAGLMFGTDRPAHCGTHF